MDGFEFENCGNAVLKCEGKILGGVEKATCTRKNREGAQSAPRGEAAARST